MNALQGPAHAELADVFDAFQADPAQWVCIVTGAGERAFCAGNDLRGHARTGAPGFPTSGFAGLTSRTELDKPLIAAVNGVAMGGGFEIALACDLIVAAETAMFALPEPRVGLAALGGGLQRLPAQIGLKRAMSMILTGRRVSAREGYELGFVNEVAPNGQLMAAANRWAQDIIACSPAAIRAAKQVARAGTGPLLSPEEVARLPAIEALRRSPDAQEGPLAFAERRPPRWRGV